MAGFAGDDAAHAAECVRWLDVWAGSLSRRSREEGFVRAHREIARQGGLDVNGAGIASPRWCAWLAASVWCFPHLRDSQNWLAGQMRTLLEVDTYYLESAVPYAPHGRTKSRIQRWLREIAPPELSPQTKACLPPNVPVWRLIPGSPAPDMPPPPPPHGLASGSTQHAVHA